jgi:hypothetical protein
MDDHVYEDPDAMPPLDCQVPILIPGDYRANFPGSSVKSRVPSRQQQRKGQYENCPKSSKNQQQQRKGQYENCPKPSRKIFRLKKGSKSSSEEGDTRKGEKQVSGGKAKFDKSKSPKKRPTKSLTEQNPVKGQNRGQTMRGHSDSGILSIPVGLKTVNPDVKEHDQHQVADEANSSPPALPSRGYLLDVEFAAELDDIRKKIIVSDTDSDDGSDDYTSMDNATCSLDDTGRSHAQTNKYVTSSMQELGQREPNGFYENSNNAKQQFIQQVATLSLKGNGPNTPKKHYKNSHKEKLESEGYYANCADTKGSPTAWQEDDIMIPERHRTSDSELPERHYGNLADTTLPEDLPPIPERSLKSKGHLLVEPHPVYDNFTNRGGPPVAASEQDKSPHYNFAERKDSNTVVSELRNIPPLPRRSYKSNTKKDLACAVESDLPPAVPERPTKQKGEYREVDTHMPPIPGRNYENFINTPPREQKDDSCNTIPLPRRSHKDNTKDDSCNTIPLPRRSHKDNTKEVCTAVKHDPPPPAVPERVPTRQEGESTPYTSEMCYGNFIDTPPRDITKWSQEEESYVPLTPARHDNGLDEDAYINQDNGPEEQEEDGYMNSKSEQEEDGYMNSKAEQEEDGYANCRKIEEDVTYDYVSSDTIRSVRGRAAERWAVKPRRK